MCACNRAFLAMLLCLASCGHAESPAMRAPTPAPTQAATCAQDSDCTLRNECGCCVAFVPPRPQPSCASMCAGGWAGVCDDQRATCRAGSCVMTPLPIPANALRMTPAAGSCGADTDCFAGMLNGCACQPYGTNVHMGPAIAHDCPTVVSCADYTLRCDVAAHECVLIPQDPHAQREFNDGP